MTALAAPTGAPAARMSLLARFLGVITSPKETFRSVAAHPEWFGALALVTLALAVLTGAFLSTSVGQTAWLEAASAGADDRGYEAMLKMSKYVGYIGVVQMLIMVPLVTTVISGIFYAVFNAGLGGNATFKQVLAVVAHAGAIFVLGQLFTVPVNYLRGKMASATNLISLLPMIDDKSFLGRLLATIDLFLIWWVIVLAIGLAVLYRRRTQPIAIGLFCAYAAIALTIAAVMSRMGGA